MSLNVSLTPHLEAFIAEMVSSGRFPSAGSLVRTALLMLEERERDRAARVELLRQEIQKVIDRGLPTDRRVPAGCSRPVEQATPGGS